MCKFFLRTGTDRQYTGITGLWVYPHRDALSQVPESLLLPVRLFDLLPTLNYGADSEHTFIQNLRNNYLKLLQVRLLP